MEKEGQNIRRAYQRRLPSDMSRDYYFMQRNTGNTESVTIEYGFLDSKGDDVNQLKNYWKRYAEAVVRAITNYIGVPYLIDNNNYIVKSGDSLWSISKKFNLSVDELKKNNNLSSNLINVGQVLNVSNNNSFNVYKVMSGDTLYSIAKKFDITVSDIMKLNNLNSNLLKIGDELIIPNLVTSQYIVNKGDTLYKIANMFNKNVSEIKKLNNLNSDILSIGQVLSV